MRKFMTNQNKPIEKKCECANCEKGLHWKEVWHLFIDHLAENKSPRLFFEELLTNKTK